MTETEQEPANHPAAPRPAIFVVDDDAAIRDSVSLTLRSIDADLETFASAEEFLERFAEPRPGCMLLDVRMREMSGIELHSKLAAEHDYLSVVIVTGHATVPMSVSLIKSGAFDVLEKPYLPEKIREVVQLGIERSLEAWHRRSERSLYHERHLTLSPREQEVHQWLIAGHENKQIARELGISPSTVEKHRLSVVRKMGADNITQLLKQRVDALGQSD